MAGPLLHIDRPINRAAARYSAENRGTEGQLTCSALAATGTDTDAASEGGMPAPLTRSGTGCGPPSVKGCAAMRLTGNPPMALCA